MGWDAFGLPAENAAISQNLSSEDWTKSNIAYMKQQLMKLGLSLDWQRELTTCNPEYYKWTQFIFIKLFEHGYVYQKESLVNWDPVDQTVLAEEQVDANGFSWRSGAKVEKRPLKQWFIRTTKLSQSLSDGLEDPCLVDWGDIIKLQKHWIGECNGYLFELPIAEVAQTNLTVWTENPELLKTCSFIAIKSGHILDKAEYLDTSSKKLKIHVRNPLNNELIPIVVSDLLEYPEGSDSFLCDVATNEIAAELAQELNTPTKSNDDLRTSDEICRLAIQGKWGGYKSSSRLRDWLVSRQRYWGKFCLKKYSFTMVHFPEIVVGTPIPMIHCKSCGTQPVPVEQLPVKLPPSDGTLKGHSALLLNENFLNVSCPKYVKNNILENLP